MVMIDGHPQYAGIFGHPIADAYQSFLAERVEVLRGPASVLYGSNAMGGVINIVTRKMQEDRVDTHLHAGYGSYNTLETELTNRVRKGRFSSVVSGSYNRTDGHRTDMGFEQYGGYAKLGCKRDTFQCLLSRSDNCPTARRRPAHYARSHFFCHGEPLRKDFRHMEFFSITGGTTGLTTDTLLLPERVRKMPASTHVTT